MKKKIFISIIIVVLVVSFLFFKILTKEDEEENIPRNEEKVKVEIVVEIKGEVLKPDVYHMSEGDRVYDLVKLAGGFTESADTNKVNLALKLTDEMVVNVPSISKDTQENKISINSANKEKLMTISGIGEAKAESIIAYRNENGPFMMIEDLLKVNGISKTLFEKIKDYITV